MKANEKFLGKGSEFWALAKYVSEQFGYSNRKSKSNLYPTVKWPSPDEIVKTLDAQKIARTGMKEDDYAVVSEYLKFRADTLNNEVQHMLMDRAQAKDEFDLIKDRVKPSLPIPWNRQRGDKRHEAYLAAMVGMLAEEVIGADNLVNDAQKLSILTGGGALKGIFSRRFDGAIPATQNPLAVWEIKEYYGTTTFGSRVAGGIYETLLDGHEVNAFEEILQRKIQHYLFLDAKLTWWNSGKSFLCRIIDMLHTGHVDEVFFGRQVVTQWPETLAALEVNLASSDHSHSIAEVDL